MTGYAARNGHLFGLEPGDRALVVATHPDDESLGLGGTIARLAGAGIEVDVLAIACETALMYGGYSDAQIRTAEFSSACAVLGVTGHRILWTDVPEAADPGAHLAELVTAIERGPKASLGAGRPRLAFIPNATAHHQHHRAVHAAALAALRPGRASCRWVPPIVLGYDGPEDQCWLAAAASRPLTVDITGFREVKEKALRCHASQLREPPHPRSLAKIAALDEAAGAAAGTEAAERFAVYRMGW